MLYCKIKKISETAIIPTKATGGSAGFDFYTDTSEPVVIYPHETVMLTTGIALEIPEGYFGAIYPRSGISTKRGLRLANCVAVIDSDYRGAVGVPIHNDTNESKYVQPHERVAQIVFQKVEPIGIAEVDELSETKRGSGGFGSTGET